MNEVNQNYGCMSGLNYACARSVIRGVNSTTALPIMMPGLVLDTNIESIRLNL
jgi:hypothetical protein